MRTNTPSQVGANFTTGVPRLRRVLTLWDLVFYGIVLIMPIAPILLFGVAQKLSHGHFVTTILVVMVVMMFTAVSYGRMAGSPENICSSGRRISMTQQAVGGRRPRLQKPN